MTDSPETDRPRLPPASQCVLCEQPLEAIGGQRLIALRSSRGLLIGQPTARPIHPTVRPSGHQPQ